MSDNVINIPTDADRRDSMGIEGLPVSLEYPYPNNPTIGILIVNLIEAFKRIEAQQHEIAALKRRTDTLFAAPSEADHGE